MKSLLGSSLLLLLILVIDFVFVYSFTTVQQQQQQQQRITTTRTGIKTTTTTTTTRTRYDDDNKRQHMSIKTNTNKKTMLNMAAVTPSDNSVVGIIGRGFVSVLIAKLSALNGYKTWILCPPGQEDTIKKLISNDNNDNNNDDYNDVISTNQLELIESSDTEKWEEKIKKTNALIFAVDDTIPIATSSIEYMLSDPLKVPNLQRVVGLSRNLNGKNMGFFVKASKMSANSEVWDGSTTNQYKEFESVLKSKTNELCNGADYTIVRAGTLKGGGSVMGSSSGDDDDADDGAEEESQFPFKQYLSKEYYDMTKKDIITWQLLFDCNARGVTLEKGDVLPGPGAQAVFTATGSDGGLPGDTSRCGIAEAIVRSLSIEKAGNIDFGIGTSKSTKPPTDDEWDALFSVL